MVQPISNANKNNINNVQWQGQHGVVNGFSTPETILPVGNRNYCLFNENKVDFFVAGKENVLPYLAQVLQTSDDEKEIVETLCIIDRMIDNGTKGVDKMYPALAKLNDSESPNVQTYLAGIYRKIQVPDAFGPLVSMLIKNSNKTSEQKSSQVFDPNEEIGGAILEYIKKWSQPLPNAQSSIERATVDVEACDDSCLDYIA